MEKLQKDVMAAMNIAIVEDNDADAEILEDFIRKYAQKKNIDLKTIRFAGGIDILSDYSPVYDIILMDIEMPHMDGMETAKRLRELNDRSPLIFITNMAQYAVNGYEVDAVGFIVKPVEYFCFSLQLDRAIDKLKSYEGNYVSLITKYKAEKIYVCDIKYVEVIKHKIIYHTFNGNLEVTGSLSETEEKLKNSNFVRCNNCYLVNLRHVKKVKAGTVTVADEELKISYTKKQEFMRRLSIYLGGGN